MSKGSKHRVTWSSLFAEKYDIIFGKRDALDISDTITKSDVEKDLNFKGGHNTERDSG
tara:strand:- start:396 stop:569 length:174 start_codon:yes stop_codon:yes gene_type:complete